MSFFLSAQEKRERRKGIKRTEKEVRLSRREKKTEKEVRLSRREKNLIRTEVSSDEEDSVGNDAGSAGSEDEYDDSHEQNYRKAKRLLEKFEEKKVVDDFVNVGDLLKEDAQQQAGTLQRELADLAELRDHKEIMHKAHRFTPLCVALSPCGKFIVSSGKESSIVKYNLVERKVVGVIKRTKKGGDQQKAHFGQIFAVAVSPDGKMIVSGGHDAVIKVWDFETLAHIKDFTAHRAPITSLCFQMKSIYLFSASRDRSVRIWDLDQLGMVDTMYGHQDAVLSLSCLQKQRVVSVGSQDRTLRLWKVEDESQLIFNGHQSCVSMDCVAMLNDDHFVSGSSDGSLCLWSTWKKKPVAVRPVIHGKRQTGEARWIVSIAAVPFSDLVATGSDDGDLKLWKVSTEKKTISQVFAYSVCGFINDLRFSADGKQLAMAVGKEHRDGRWWVEKEATNSVVVLPVHYGQDDDNQTNDVTGKPLSAELLSSSDEEEEEEDQVE